MTILGIETSCDETSVAIIEGKKDFVDLKSNIVASSLAEHAATGGIIPENAARAQLKFMLPVLTEALGKAFGLSEKNISTNPPPIDAIAVTYGPGLIGPLLIGVETARVLSYAWEKPVIPVNHMLGHIYANFINGIQIENDKWKNEKMLNEKIPKFPLIALVVSGGHTDLLHMQKHGNYEVLGGTRDDAAGEAFDKIGRLLGLPYPAGPVIEKLAKKGDAQKYKFPRPLSDKATYDFSFSGLKTAVLREVIKLRHPEPTLAGEGSLNPVVSSSNPSFQKNDGIIEEQTINDIAAGTQTAIIDVLVKKTLRAVKEYNANSLLLSGGVVANQGLRDAFKQSAKDQGLMTGIFAPQKSLCTDNAAMIASAAYFNQQQVDWKDLTANPELYYE